MNYTIGVDPAHGWAVNQNRVLIACGTVPGLPELTAKLIELKAQYPLATVYVELPENKHIYYRSGTSPAIMQCIARKVGENRAKAQVLFDHCKSLWGPAVVKYAPPTRHYVKVKAKRFNRITGWKERTSEHARDAACLIIGR